MLFYWAVCCAVGMGEGNQPFPGGGTETHLQLSRRPSALQGWVFVGQNQAGHARAMVNTQQPPNWSLPRELWLQKSMQLRELTSGMVGNSTKDAELCRELQP